MNHLATFSTLYDVAVIGGGINGVGIARDLAGRGLRVVLCEKDDLAAHTSSASTKLIHGGLRYLEHYDFKLVKKALAERELLLQSAPHIMWPLQFVMPHHPGIRPAWLIRAGLFLYDHLAPRRFLSSSHHIQLKTHVAGAPLQAQYHQGFTYADGWVDDARLVVLNAVDAAEHGASILNGWRCQRAEREAQQWLLTLQHQNGETQRLHARSLVNATGAWAVNFLQENAHLPQRRTLRLVKGSHIIVPRCFEHDHAYIFQSPDQRIIFALPYESDFTLIGTTDVDHEGSMERVQISTQEIDYLCEKVSQYFKRPVTPADVVGTYAGIRPLLGDPARPASEVTRDYELEMDTQGAALLTVWGGKITTYRRLAEEAAQRLCAHLGHAQGTTRQSWTSTAYLPGGDLSAWIEPTGHPVHDFAAFKAALAKRYPQWPAKVLHDLARRHGSRIERVTQGSDDLGQLIVPGLYESEVRYLMENEWARTADDILWRRTKLGLHLTPEQRETVVQWLETH